MSPVRRSWQREIDLDEERRIMAERRASESRVTAERSAPEPINLTEYVRASFDGAVGDHDLPFASQDAARDTIAQQIARRFRRPLTASERTYLDITVAVEWNRRYATPCAAVAGIR